VKPDEVRRRVEEIGIIPAIRVSSSDDALFAAEGVSNGGIPIVEVTMTVPGALEVVAELARHHPHMIVGAGTVLDLETARRCLDAGARYLTSPGLDLSVVEFGRAEQVAVWPGVLTPSEVMAARKAGCEMVKVFPCAQVGGPKYIRALTRPFPDMKFIAAGGVTQTTALEFILSGAAALGIGSELIPPECIEHRHPDRIRELARRFLGMVRAARQQLADAAEQPPA
jgi:2-dehydro-3-deoxyphosphogluconate aldolase/(4S)-4-hydroxy-2-oxoglutarate aldolase